uniref:TSPc domain-containing protein n=1 Tax=Ascaris lumbricoides TaxID=6252 RepID=A0A0M3IS67_ASCLU
MGLFGADGYIFPPIGDLCAMIDFLCGKVTRGRGRYKCRHGGLDPTAEADGKLGRLIVAQIKYYNSDEGEENMLGVATSPSDDALAVQVSDAAGSIDSGGESSDQMSSSTANAYNYRIALLQVMLIKI